MLEWTGERFIPGVGAAELAYEHFGRYLFATRLAAEREVLDIGSGEGYGAFLLARAARRVLGIDVSEVAIEHARRRYRCPNLTFQTSSATALPSDGAFGAITCFELIEHVSEEEQHALLAEVLRVLTDDGLFVISTPNKPVYREAGGGRDYENPYHVREMTFDQFRTLLESYFSHIRWYGQQMLVGNYIHALPVAGPPASGEPAVHIARVRSNELVTGVAAGTDQAKYLLAVCAKQPAALERLTLPSDFVLVDNAGRAADEWQAAAKYASERDQRRTNLLSWRLLSYYGRIKYRYLLPIYRLLGLMPPESIPVDTAFTASACETIPMSDCTPEVLARPSLYDVIVLPIIDWDFRFQRPQQLAVRFARAGHRVFYARTTFREQQIPTIRLIEERVVEVQLPGSSYINLYSHTIDERLVAMLYEAFASLRRECGIVEAVCFVNLPFWRPLALTLRDRFGWKIVYDCMDHHPGFSGVAKAVLDEEDELSRASDLVVTSSRPLCAAQSQRNPNCMLVPNATDFDHFHSASHRLPDELGHLAKPIIGYYGAIADWFDSELIHELALARPQWNFVLIGRTRGANLAPLRHLKNVHLLGEKPYSALPGYLHAFDVCIIPFKKTPLTEATNPVKLFEFFSAGKAVVATDLTELRHYADYVELASTLEQWLLAIEKALHDHSPEHVTARVEFARRNTWDERILQITQRIIPLYPKVSIIIVTHNNLDYTRLCLESVYKKTVYPNYEVIVLDNASTDGTVEFLKTFEATHPNFEPIFNEMNEGFARANNRGIAAATGEYVIFLNNDTIVTRAWLSGLLTHLRDPRVGMVGPVTNFSGNESRIFVNYRAPDEIESFAERYTCAHEGQAFHITVLALFCVAMRRSVVNEVGLLDERFGIGMFEDDDYALRVKQKGYKVMCAEDVFVHHWGRASFSKLDQDEYRRLFDENRRKFEEKWDRQWEPHRYRSGSQES